MIHTKSKEYYQTIAALAFGSFAIFANLYCVQPLLPLFSQEYDKDLLDSTFVLTMGTFGLAGSLILYGALSDAVGRYWLMLFSIFGSFIVSLLMLTVSSFDQLLWLRLLHGLVLGALPAVAIAYIGEEFSPYLIPGVVGLYIATNTLGGISGRLVGGFISDFYHWKMLYWVMAVINFWAFVLLYYWLTPPKHFVKQPIRFVGMLKDIYSHLRNFNLLAVYLVIGLSFGVFINLYTYLAFILVKQPFNVGTGFIGLLFLTYLAGTVASIISSRFTAKIGPLNSILIGLMLLMIGIVLLFSPSLVVKVFGLLINSFGLFMAHSVSSGWVNRQAVRAKGSASALYLVFYYLGATLAPTLLYPFWSINGWNSLLIGAELYILCAVLIMIILIKWQPNLKEH